VQSADKLSCYALAQNSRSPPRILSQPLRSMDRALDSASRPGQTARATTETTICRPHRLQISRSGRLRSGHLNLMCRRRLSGSRPLVWTGPRTQRARAPHGQWSVESDCETGGSHICALSGSTFASNYESSLLFPEKDGTALESMPTPDNEHVNGKLGTEDFDEAKSAASFQDALNGWRNAGSEEASEPAAPGGSDHNSADAAASRQRRAQEWHQANAAKAAAASAAGPGAEIESQTASRPLYNSRPSSAASGGAQRCDTSLKNVQRGRRRAAHAHCAAANHTSRGCLRSQRRKTARGRRCRASWPGCGLRQRSVCSRARRPSWQSCERRTPSADRSTRTPKCRTVRALRTALGLPLQRATHQVRQLSTRVSACHPFAARALTVKRVREVYLLIGRKTPSQCWSRWSRRRKTRIHWRRSAPRSRRRSAAGQLCLCIHSARVRWGLSWSILLTASKTAVHSSRWFS
jgi:hypothetical protein